MANFIQIPLYSTTPTGGVPRYALVRVDDVYDCDISGSNEHIRLYTTQSADTTDVQVSIIEYFGGTTVVTAQDIENIKDLIVFANQNPSSSPVFNLIGAATASYSDLPKYQVDGFALSSLPPL
jgi:hypothetical protein